MQEHIVPSKISHKNIVRQGADFPMWKQQWEFINPETCYFKQVSWSPDGSHLLGSDNSNQLRLFDANSCSPKFTYKEPETIYDTTWNPIMNSHDPSSCYFAVTARSQPIHLYESCSSRLIASYSAYDSYDELTSAISISISPNGKTLFGGDNKALRSFTIDTPGRQVSEVEMQGLISTIGFSNVNPKLFATGSYSGMVTLSDTDTWELEALFCKEQATIRPGGVSQVKIVGNDLLVSGRRHGDIVRWDLRNLDEPLLVYSRELSTNQRIYFDVDRSGSILVTGSENGDVRTYSFTDSSNVIPTSISQDVVCGVALHPNEPLLASCTGSRKYNEDQICDSKVLVSSWNTSVP